jgi:hypothetical protein
LHWNEHVPLEQAGVPLGGALHCTGQEPQWLGSVFLFVSQPGAPVQSNQPV